MSQRLTKIQAHLVQAGLDALVLITQDSPRADGNNKNVDYVSGFTGSTGAVVVSKQGAVLVVDGRYSERAKQESTLSVVPADGTNRGVVNFLNYVTPGLTALGLSASSRVGYESKRVSSWLAHEWEVSNVAQFVPTVGVVESLRQWKSEEEIAYLRDACAKTCAVWAACMPQIVAGATEREVGLMFDVALRAHGATGNSFGTIVASGPNSASPHHDTSDRVLEAGDPVTVDFGGVFSHGYCSDLTRTVFVPGRAPDPKLVEIYTTVLEANRRAREALKVGMTWKEYDAVARDYITSAGYGAYFTHGLGHSLGLEAHDPFTYAGTPFETGLVITDEPGIYVPGVGGVRIEDDLVLTDTGVENLTPAEYCTFA